MFIIVTNAFLSYHSLFLELFKASGVICYSLHVETILHKKLDTEKEETLTFGKKKRGRIRLKGNCKCVRNQVRMARKKKTVAENEIDTEGSIFRTTEKIRSYLCIVQGEMKALW